jgi:hypothetical protein
MDFIKMGVPAVLTAAVLILGSPASAEAKPSLEDFRFMVGHWADPETGGPEEIWTAPRGGAMSGMMRWASAGGSGIYVLELLTIVEEEVGIRFYFKHFDTHITPWEKEEANTYKLVSLNDNCARFDLINENPKVPAVQQYCRLDATTLEYRGADAETPIDETDFVLTFTLQGARAE